MAYILCIDDDPDSLEFCKAALEPQGHSVRTALSGEEGYKTAKEIKPDLVIMDVMMSTRTEGFHTTYKFRKDAKLRYVPILMLTSVNEKTGMRCDKDADGEFLPVDEFLDKPVKPQTLADAVKRLLKLPKNKINIG